jgi:hypothetical protein
LIFSYQKPPPPPPPRNTSGGNGWGFRKLFGLGPKQETSSYVPEVSRSYAPEVSHSNDKNHSI